MLSEGLLRLLNSALHQISPPGRKIPKTFTVPRKWVLRCRF